jgi:prophage regulatory protein
MILIDNQNYLTPQESAKLLNVSMPTLWRWVKAGKLNKKCLSQKKIYFSQSEIEGMFK